MVIDESERLDRLVANLLSLSRIEAGALLPDASAVDIGELVEACVAPPAAGARPGPARARRRARLPLVTADYTPARPGLTNLLENAARHSPPGGTVSVEAAVDGTAVAAPRGGDEGPGSDPGGARPHLRAVRHRDRRLVERRRASRSVAASSRPTTARSPCDDDRRRRAVRVTLPSGGARPVPEAERARRRRRRQPGAGADGRASRPAATRCAWPRPARAALETGRRRRSDVVILDLGLPDIDGIEVCRHLRLRTPSPIIVLSADGAEDRKVAALDDGADDYLTKPFSMPELLARVRVAVRHRRALGVGGRRRARCRSGRCGSTSRRTRRCVGGRPLDLTPKEFALLALLARNAGQGADPPDDPRPGVGPGPGARHPAHPRQPAASQARRTVPARRRW